MNNYVINGKLIMEFSEEDIANLIRKQVLMKNAPEDICKITCSKATVVFDIDDYWRMNK